MSTGGVNRTPDVIVNTLERVQPMTRRQMLKRAGALGLGLAAASSLLAACGGSDSNSTSSSGATSTTTTSSSGAGATTTTSSGTSSGSATSASGESGTPNTGTSAPTTGTGGGTSAPGEGKPGGNMMLALNSDLTTMDPHKSTAAVDRQVFQLIYDKLVDIDDGLNIVPELSSQWEISEDGMTYTFSLVEGVTFHNGEAFNATAAKANFDRMLDDATASPRKSEIAQITNVEAVDDKTLKLTLSQAFSPLLATLSDRAGMMISPKAITELGDDLARNPVGTGAFTFVEWVKDDHLTVKKNPSWWQEGLPYLDQVTYKPITDASVRLTTLKTGDVHMIDQLSAKDVQSVKADNSLVYDEVAGLGFTYISLNAQKAPFDNIALRQAVAWCFDRDAINKTLFFGTGAPAQTPIPPSSWAYDDSVQVFKQDYDKAKEKLTEGGQPDGFEFDMLVTNSPDAVQLAEAYKAQLAEAKINANIVLLEFGTLLDRSNNSDFQAVSLGWSGRPDPDGNIYSYFHTDGGLNRGGYSNTQVDDLLEQTRKVADTSKRKDLYTQVTTLIAQDAPMIFIRFPAEIKVWQPVVKGYVHVPDGMMRMDKVWLDQG
jgi:peptide/nickel transport system substrate-binding protein